MKPYERQAALDNLRKVRRLAVRIQDNDLLEILARDIEPNNTRDPDPYHHSVQVGVCEQLDKAAHALLNAVNVCAHLLDTTPAKGRSSTIEDCMACGEPALPRPIKGLCAECLKEYKSDNGKCRWQSHGDFLAQKRKQSV
jgi:hypothetical protein